MQGDLLRGRSTCFCYTDLRSAGHMTYQNGSCLKKKVVVLGVDSSWNVMAHGDAREEKWSGNWRMEWVASTLQTTSEHGVSSITTADAYTSAASSRLNWRPSPFKWTRAFRWKTKSGFFTCAITFRLASTVPIFTLWIHGSLLYVT